MTQQDTTPSPEAVLAALTVLERATSRDWRVAVEMMDGPDERLQRVEELSGALHALANTVGEDINAVQEGEQAEAEATFEEDHAKEMFGNALHSAHLASMAFAYTAQLEAAWSRHRALERAAEAIPEAIDSEHYEKAMRDLI